MSDSLSEEMQKWLESLTPEERAILADETEVKVEAKEAIDKIHKAAEPKPTVVIIEEYKMYKCDFKDAEGNVCGKTYDTKQKLGTHKAWHTRSKAEMALVRAARKGTVKVDYKKATETLQKENAEFYKENKRLEVQIKQLLSENDTLSGLHAELNELKVDWEQALQREQHLKDKLMALQERFIDKLDGGS